MAAGGTVGFPRRLRGKGSAYRSSRCRRRRFDPWVGKIPGGENGSPLQHSYLENPRVRGARGQSPWGHKELDRSEATQHTGTHTCIHSFQMLFPYRSSQSTEQSSLCYTVGPYQLSILYMVTYSSVYKAIPVSQFIPPPPILKFLPAPLKT